jgi:hypothetical protein
MGVGLAQTNSSINKGYLRKITAMLLFPACLLFCRLAAQTSAFQVATSNASVDAARLKTGQFTYRSVDHGKNVGKGEILIRKLADSENYEFSEDFKFSEEYKGFRSQRWQSVATSGFEPISATLSFAEGDGYATVFDLKYVPGRVTGFDIKRNNSGTGHSVDAALPANTVDQRIDWARVLANDLVTGQQFEFNVYDPGTGVSRAAAQVGDIERIQVPAGTFDAYRVNYQIQKSGRTEEYQVFASQNLPRVLLREEFPNGSVDELTESRK